MVKHSKRYSAVAEKVEEDRLYEPEAAIALTKDLSTGVLLRKGDTGGAGFPTSRKDLGAGIGKEAQGHN